MARKTNAALALALSAVLALGTIPAPALAEMAEEAMGTEPVAAQPAPAQEQTMGEEPVSPAPESTPGTPPEGNADPAPAEPGLVPQAVPQPSAERNALGGIAGPPVPTVHDANETPSLSTQATLPSAYSSVDQYVTPVRNQNPQGTCWAFALTAAVEASMLRSGMVPASSRDTLDLSERHLAYFTFNTPPDPLGNTGNDRTGVRTSKFTPSGPNTYTGMPDRWSYLNNSCNAQVSSMTLANWTGAAAEEVAPYTPLNYMTAYCMENQMSYADFLAETALSNDIARSAVVHVKDIDYIAMRDSDKVKQAVMDHGAVTTVLYANSGEADAMAFKQDASGSYRAYACYNGDKDADHGVAIVGWDDGVSRDMFSREGSDAPECDGAWLCKNSWGSWWSEDGYFWLSYDDKFSKSDHAALAFTMEPTDAEDNLYMHDGGASDYYNYVDSGGSVASVFEAKASATGELLDAVSFLTWSTNVDYSVQVYMDPQRSDDPTSGTAMLAEPLAGKVESAGLHKIDLPQGKEIPLYPGARYAVVATLSHADGTRVSYGVDVNVSKSDSFYTNEIEARAGESYERNNPSSPWKDLATTTSIDPGDERNCTARVRAYTRDADLTSRASLGRAQIAAVPDQTHTGAEVRPALTVTLDGHVLRAGRDYTVEYRNNVNKGTATAVVRGAGIFSGERTANFNIVERVTPKATAVNGTDWSAVYDPEWYAERNPDVASWARRSDGTIDGNKLLSHFANNGRKEGRASKQGFELASYYNANADLRRAFGTDWARYYDHYRSSGQRERRTCAGVTSLRGAVTSRDGVDWAPAYDANFYAQRNPDVANWARRSFSSGSVLDDAALLQHFVSSGTKEARASKASFDVRSYFNANPDLRGAFGGSADWSKYYRHYATNGSKEGRKCSGTDQLQGTVAKLGGTDWSPVYDRAYYGQKNPDIVSWATRRCGSATVLDDYAMLSHFANNGRKEGRASKASFELASYYNANSDLRRAFGTDWARYYDHYRANGQREGRAATGVGQLRGAVTVRDGVDWAPAYDANFYAQANPDVARWATRTFASGSVLDDVALLSHFVNNGAKEARPSKDTFDVRAYRSRYADLDRAFGSDWKAYYRHYATNGSREGRTGKLDLAAATVSAVPAQTYSGEQIRPAVTVTYGGARLAEGTDYAASYGQNLNVGEGTVTLEGRGRFAGTRTVRFSIARASVLGAEVSFTYANGENVFGNGTYRLQPQSTTVKVGGRVLREGVDYELTFRDCISRCVAVVKGIGNWRDTDIVEANGVISGKPITYDEPILATAIADVECVDAPGRYVMLGDAKTVASNLTHNGQRLVEGTDYSIARTCSDSPGSSKITIRGLGKSTVAGEYYGQRTFEFEIVDPATADLVHDVFFADVTGIEETVDSADFVQHPTVIMGQKQLVEGRDYVVACKRGGRPWYPNSMYVVISGIGDYCGAAMYRYQVAS